MMSMCLGTDQCRYQGTLRWAKEMWDGAATVSTAPSYLELLQPGRLISFLYISHLHLKFSYLFIQRPTVNFRVFTSD